MSGGRQFAGEHATQRGTEALSSAEVDFTTVPTQFSPAKIGSATAAALSSPAKVESETRRGMTGFLHS